jgi:hypothetical protein
MSETAHDLKSPLTTVRESIRIVHDGYVGEVSREQQEYLASAMDQCECIDQMIGEMVQLERLRTGTPRVNRHWTPLADVRQAIDDTLRPWAMPRQIEILWDGADDSSKVVFADALMLRRLVVNLVTNAIRATPEGGTILIRLQDVREGEAIQWSIIDQGSGISENVMQQIADRQTGFSEGEGLGLAICRQLSALHFSVLQMRSRLGSGTEVSFETACGGPRSIANAWAKWRVSQRGPLQKPKHKSSLSQSSTGERRIRLDPPVVSAELRHEATLPRCEDRLAAGIVSVGGAVAREAADNFDEVLQSQLQMFDFVYRINTRRWVWIFDTDEHGVADRIGAITDSVATSTPNVRMTWSTAQMIPLDPRRTQARLSDLMVRETLAASASTNLGFDRNEVRLGTSPIEESEIASARLDEELKRLSTQFQTQSKNLQQQAHNLRSTQ